MQLSRAILRRSGIFDFVLQRFVDGVLVPFATYGQISLEEARFLSELAAEAQSERPIIEIGSLFGSSTKVLLTAKKPDQPLIAVDLFSWNPAQLTPEQHFMVTTLGLECFAEKIRG